jgi:hypothetical protein
MSTQSDLRNKPQALSESDRPVANGRQLQKAMPPPDVTVGFLSIPMLFLFPVVGLRYYV